MFDDATISRLADEAAIPLAVARDVCQWVERQPNVVNPLAMARHCCAARRARAAAQPPTAQSQSEQARGSFSRSQRQDLDSVRRADPQVAGDALAAVRAMIDRTPEWQPARRA